MSMQTLVDTYLKGWELGDAALSLSATADSFHYDDPNTGRISREQFVDFVNDFKRAAETMGGTKNANPFLLYTDTVFDLDTSPATVWCWWQAAGTDLQGCALIKVDDSGVLHEKIAYFSRLPD